MSKEANELRLALWAKAAIAQAQDAKIEIAGVTVILDMFGESTYNATPEERARPFRFAINASAKCPFRGCSGLYAFNTIEDAIVEIIRSYRWALNDCFNVPTKQDSPFELVG